MYVYRIIFTFRNILKIKTWIKSCFIYIDCTTIVFSIPPQFQNGVDKKYLIVGIKIASNKKKYHPQKKIIIESGSNVCYMPVP